MFVFSSLSCPTPAWWRPMRSLTAIVTFCATFLALSGCSEAPPVVTESIRPVKTILVSAGSAAEKLVQTGEIRPSEETSLGFRIDGRLVQRLVDVGAVVKAGAVIATLDPSDSDNQLKAAKAQFDSAVSAEKLAQSNFNRLQQLSPGGAVSAAQLEQAKSEYEASLSARQSAEANVTSARDRLSFTRLTTSSDGIVSAVAANPGQVVSAGQEIVRLASLSGRDAVFDVSESLIHSHQGQPQVLVTLLSDPSIQAVGQIRDVSPVADPVTRTIRVRVKLEQPPAAFGFGATVQGSIDKPASDVVLIPASALTRAGTEPAVYVVDPQSSQLQLKPVSISRYTEQDVVISAGLNGGEQVVIAGVAKLRPGMTVRLLTEPKA